MDAFHKSRKGSIPRVQRVRRVLVDGTSHFFHYHRPTRRRLPDPSSQDFAAAYEVAEREFAETQQVVPSTSPAEMLSPPLAPRIRRAESEDTQSSQAGGSTSPIREVAPAKTATPNDDMPLYPDEAEIALAVLGPRRAHEWKAKAIVLERYGLPPIDPFMGGRFWLAVLMFFYDRNALDARIVAGVKSSASVRIRSVPFMPDGREVLDGEEASSAESRRNEHRTRRSRI